jgi:hypothetical protein
LFAAPGAPMTHGWLLGDRADYASGPVVLAHPAWYATAGLTYPVTHTEAD